MAFSAAMVAASSCSSSAPQIFNQTRHVRRLRITTISGCCSNHAMASCAGERPTSRATAAFTLFDPAAVTARWGECHGRNAAPAQPRQQRANSTPRRPRPEHLIGRHAIPAGGNCCMSAVSKLETPQARIFPCVFSVSERLDRVGERMPPANAADSNRGSRCPDRFRLRSHAAIVPVSMRCRGNLADQIQPLAGMATLLGAANHGFGTAFAIHLRVSISVTPCSIAARISAFHSRRPTIVRPSAMCRYQSRGMLPPPGNGVEGITIASLGRCRCQSASLVRSGDQARQLPATGARFSRPAAAVRSQQACCSRHSLRNPMARRGPALCARRRRRIATNRTRIGALLPMCALFALANDHRQLLAGNALRVERLRDLDAAIAVQRHRKARERAPQWYITPSGMNISGQNSNTFGFADFTDRHRDHDQREREHHAHDAPESRPATAGRPGS